MYYKLFMYNLNIRIFNKKVDINVLGVFTDYFNDL